MCFFQGLFHARVQNAFRAHLHEMHLLLTLRRLAYFFLLFVCVCTCVMFWNGELSLPQCDALFWSDSFVLHRAQWHCAKQNVLKRSWSNSRRPCAQFSIWLFPSVLFISLYLFYFYTFARWAASPWPNDLSVQGRSMRDSERIAQRRIHDSNDNRTWGR